MQAPLVAGLEAEKLSLEVDVYVLQNSLHFKGCKGSTEYFTVSFKVSSGNR